VASLKPEIHFRVTENEDTFNQLPRLEEAKLWDIQSGEISAKSHTGEATVSRCYHWGQRSEKISVQTNRSL